MRSTRSQLRWLAGAARLLAEAESVADLSRFTDFTLYLPFRLSAVGVEEIDRRGANYLMHSFRGTGPLPPDFEAAVHDHPGIPHVLQPDGARLLVLSQMAEYPSWLKTDHYNLMAHPMGWGDQLLLVARGPGLIGIVDASRDRPFTRAESALLGLIQPHFHAAWARVQPADAGRFVEPMPTELMLSADRVPQSPTAAHERVLRIYFPRWRGSGLPDEIDAWVRILDSRFRGEVPGEPPRPLAADSVRGRLFIRCFPLAHADGFRLRFLERPSRPCFLRLQELRLTRRECEILHWISAGGTNATIAARLGCAAGTVAKHVEHILDKLQVENRATACARAVEFLERRETDRTARP